MGGKVTSVGRRYHRKGTRRFKPERFQILPDEEAYAVPDTATSPPLVVPEICETAPLPH
jgi:hypothetical protein